MPLESGGAHGLRTSDCRRRLSSCTVLQNSTFRAFCCLLLCDFNFRTFIFLLLIYYLFSTFYGSSLGHVCERLLSFALSPDMLLRCARFQLGFTLFTILRGGLQYTKRIDFSLIRDAFSMPSHHQSTTFLSPFGDDYNTTHTVVECSQH